MFIVQQEILHYLRHIKNVWSHLLQGDKGAMRKVDRATVIALQLRAPRTSTYDANFLRGRIFGGEIFTDISDHERRGILERLQTVQGLIPSLDDFFANLNYLATLADCIKWLTPISRRETVAMTMERIFFDAEGMPQDLMDTTEKTIVPTSMSLTRRLSFGYRSLIVFAMRNYRRIPKKPSGKDLLAKPTLEVDKTVLREFADLARNLGFHSPEINEMQNFPAPATTEAASVHPTPILVADGPGVSKGSRSGMPRVQAYNDERQFLALDHLHRDTEEVGEGITSIFVRKDIYRSFFGEWSPNETTRTAQERPRQNTQGMAQTEQTQLRQRTVEQENLERERRRLDEAIRGQEHAKQQEQERLNRAQWELKGLEQKTLEQEQLIKLEREKFEYARSERGRLEQELKKEKEALEQKRREEETLQQARADQQIQANQQKTFEEERKQEEEHRNQEAQLFEEENDEQENPASESTKLQGSELAASGKRITRLDMPKLLSSTSDNPPGESSDHRESRVLANASEDSPAQPRTIQNANGSTDPTSPPAANSVSTSDESKTRPNKDTIPVRFQIREHYSWKTVRECQQSEVESAAKGFMARKYALFDTDLYTVLPQDCLSAAIAGETYTILVVPEARINIDDAFVESVETVITEASSRHNKDAHKRLATNNISRILRAPKRHQRQASSSASSGNESEL